MRYLDFLRGVHEALQPPTYLEVGVRHGDSLALSRATSIGVDPAFKIRAEITCPVALYRETSDDFFARPDPRAFLAGERVAMAFIDGLHLFEFALRDFINVERHAEWWAPIVFDDILPRDVSEAARDRQTRAWTGDVYKVEALLRRERLDLVCLRVNTKPTGLLVVLGADPAAQALHERYDDLVAEGVVPDPQPVPAEVLERHGALDPQQLLDSELWVLLREARANATPRDEGLRHVRRLLGLPDPAGRGLLRRAAERLRPAR
jgi:hypothetical protein